MTRQMPYEPLPASVLFGEDSFGKNVERGKNGLGNLAGGNPGRVLAAGDAGGKKVKARWSGNAADKPAERRDVLLRVEGTSSLASKDRLTGSRERHDVEHRVHTLGCEGQLASVKAAEKLHLLVRRDSQRTLKPELGHAACQVIVAVTDFGDDLLVSLQADARRQRLIIPNAGRGKGAPQSLVLIPGLDGTASAIPRQGEISAAGHAGLQSYQGVEHLEGRARRCAGLGLFRLVT